MKMNEVKSEGHVMHEYFIWARKKGVKKGKRD